MKNRVDSAPIRRLAVILNDSNDAITVQDLEGNILAWNKGAVKMYGYTELEALLLNVKDLIPADVQVNELAYINQISSGETVDSFETKRLSKDGIIMDVWIVATCLKNNSGIIDSIATTERDITHIKNQMRQKEMEVKILKGLLHICASCKEIRDDKGYWHQIESYIRDHSGADFSHSICPKCVKRLYPGLCPSSQK